MNRYRDNAHLVLSRCVLRDCPECLTPSMMEELVRAGVQVPIEVVPFDLRAKIPPNTNLADHFVRHPTNDP